MKCFPNRNSTQTRILAVVVSLMVTGIAAAQFTPTFSIDFQSPTAGGTPGAATGFGDAFFGAPIDEGQILTQGVPGSPGPNPPLPGPLSVPGSDGRLHARFGRWHSSWWAGCLARALQRRRGRCIVVRS